MPSPIYLLDNNVVSYFLNAEQKTELARIASSLSVGVVREVHEEALRYKRKGDEYRAWQPSSGITVLDISVGGAASTCLGKLKTTTGIKDLGELASIALAFEDEALVVVSNDHNGLVLALAELVGPGERVIKFSTFLRRAHTAVGLSRTCVSAVATKSQLPRSPPTWWADWFATLG